MILGSFVLLLLAETAYFTRRCAGAILRLRGEKAFFAMDLTGSWRKYQAALAWGGARDRIETDEAEVLLFGLDQIEAGLKPATALPPKESIRRTLDLLADRLRDSPRGAYQWSLAADTFLQEEQRRRREATLDLGTLSEDPLENVSPERWRAIAALETASRLEPHNYIYHDMLVDLFLEVGSPGEAAPFCRRAVAAYPAVSDHKYLLDEGLDPILLEAAIQGFEEALERPSMIPRATIEYDTGWLLANHGTILRALPYLENAVRSDPGFYEAQYYLGVLLYGLKRYDEAGIHLRNASMADPSSPDPHFHLGYCELENGRPEAAIEQFELGRKKDPEGLKFFLALGGTLEKVGRQTDAERQFVAATNVHPESAEAWLSLLDFYRRQNDARGEARSCSKVLSLKPVADIFRPRCAEFDLGGHS